MKGKAVRIWKGITPEAVTHGPTGKGFDAVKNGVVPASGECATFRADVERGLGPTQHSRFVAKEKATQRVAFRFEMCDGLDAAGAGELP